MQLWTSLCIGLLARDKGPHVDQPVVPATGNRLLQEIAYLVRALAPEGEPCSPGAGTCCGSNAVY